VLVDLPHQVLGLLFRPFWFDESASPAFFPSAFLERGDPVGLVHASNIALFGRSQAQKAWNVRKGGLYTGNVSVPRETMNIFKIFRGGGVKDYGPALERARWRMHYVVSDFTREMGKLGWTEIHPHTVEVRDPYGTVGVVVTYRRGEEQEIHRFRIKKGEIDHVVLQEGGSICLTKTTALTSPTEPLRPAVDTVELPFGGSPPSEGRTSPATKTARVISDLARRVAKGLPEAPPGGWIESSDSRPS